MSTSHTKILTLRGKILDAPEQPEHSCWIGRDRKWRKPKKDSRIVSFFLGSMLELVAYYKENINTNKTPTEVFEACMKKNDRYYC